MKNLHGHTLAELMICLSIGGTLLGIALPSLTTTLHNARQAEATNLMLGAVYYARSSAALGRQRVSLCSGETQCVRQRTWQNDLLVFTDANNNGQIDPGDTLLRQITTPARASWYWSSFRNLHYLQFDTDGTTRAANGTLTLCLENQPSRQIVINITGRPRTQSPTAKARCR